jgi:hypothetical protein
MVKLVLIAEGATTIIMRFCKIGLQFNGAIKCCDCLI